MDTSGNGRNVSAAEFSDRRLQAPRLFVEDAGITSLCGVAIGALAGRQFFRRMLERCLGDLQRRNRHSSEQELQQTLKRLGAAGGAPCLADCDCQIGLVCRNAVCTSDSKPHEVRRASGYLLRE
jgi:hypothetical protein